MKYFILCTSLIFTSQFGWASNQSVDIGTTSGDFLRLGVGARAIAMGEAYTAVVDDANALFWNPAALSLVNQHSVCLNHSAYVDSIFYDYLAYGKKLAEGKVFGIGLNYLSVGNITKTDDIGNNTGTFNPSDTVFAVGYSQVMNGLSLGISTKYIQSKIIDSAKTVALDGGLLSPIFNNKYRWGLSFSNLGGQLKYENKNENLPLLIRLGSFYQVSKNWLTSLDIVAPKNNQVYFALGTEYELFRDQELRLAGRAGYNSKTHGDIDGFSGAAFGLGLAFDRFSFDYGFLPFGNIDLTHFISVNFKY